MSEEEDNGNKVIFIGETFVGKTNLIKVSLGKPFDPNPDTTWSASYAPKEFIYDNQKYTFNLWDTIGQEKYRALTKIFFKGAIIAIIVYDITKKKTFEALEYWYEQLKEQIGEDFILAIVGNKIDLYTKQEVTEEEGKNFAASKGAKFKLSSAKDNPLNFTEFLEELFRDYLDKNKNNKKDRSRGLSITKSSIKDENKKKGCC